jgi:hypothetical protein
MKTVINKIKKINLVIKLQKIKMKQFKYFIKYILLKIPYIDFIFIYINYKIFNTVINIHNHTSHSMIMTKRNFAIYDTRNAGKITGVDNNMNYEYAFSKKIIEICDKKKIFFDIGASYGHYAWLAGKLCKKVYCFEGDDLELFFLRKNLKDYNNVEIINKYISKDYNLNKICNKFKFYPDVVKIDIEGYEVELISDAEDLLKNGCYFLIEFHQRKILKKYNNAKIIEDFYKLFEKYNYQIEYNQHHESILLKEQGISSKEWAAKRPNIHNYALFASPKIKIL